MGSLPPKGPAGGESDGQERKRRREEEGLSTTTRRSSSSTSTSQPHQKKARLAVRRTFKVYLAHDDIRRFTIPLYRHWDVFEKLLRTQYPWAFAHAEGRVVIRYEDESGDPCILSSQPEWEALCCNTLLGPIIRVRVTHEMPRIVPGLYRAVKAEQMDGDEAAMEHRRADADRATSQYGYLAAVGAREKEKGYEEGEIKEEEEETEEEEEVEVEEAMYSSERAPSFDLGASHVEPPSPVGSLEELAWSTEASAYGSMSQSDDSESMLLDDDYDHEATARVTSTTTTTTTTASEMVTTSTTPTMRAEERGQQREEDDDEGEEVEAVATKKRFSVPTIVVEPVEGEAVQEEGEPGVDQGSQLNAADEGAEERQRQRQLQEEATSDEGEQDGIFRRWTAGLVKLFFDAPSSPMLVDASALPDDKKAASARKKGRRRLRRSTSK